MGIIVEIKAIGNGLDAIFDAYGYGSWSWRLWSGPRFVYVDAPSLVQPMLVLLLVHLVQAKQLDQGFKMMSTIV